MTWKFRFKRWKLRCKQKIRGLYYKWFKYPVIHRYLFSTQGKAFVERHPKLQPYWESYRRKHFPTFEEQCQDVFKECGPDHMCCAIRRIMDMQSAYRKIMPVQALPDEYLREQTPH